MEALFGSSSSSYSLAAPPFCSSAKRALITPGPQLLSLSPSSNQTTARPSVFCAATHMSTPSPLSHDNAERTKEAKLWGGRFEESVTDAVEKFTESISFDKALYKQDIMGSKAHAEMLARQGLMSNSDKDSILQGLDKIERQIEAGSFVWRADREDVHMNIEAALTDLVGEPAKKLHTARSRNDQVCTDFRLWCRDAIDTIVGSIKHLQVI